MRFFSYSNLPQQGMKKNGTRYRSFKLFFRHILHMFCSEVPQSVRTAHALFFKSKHPAFVHSGTASRILFPIPSGFRAFWHASRILFIKLPAAFIPAASRFGRALAGMLRVWPVHRNKALYPGLYSVLLIPRFHRSAPAAPCAAVPCAPRSCFSLSPETACFRCHS